MRPRDCSLRRLLDIQDDDEAAIVKRLGELKEKIKNRSLTPAELRGYSITLSNYGTIAGRYASPVVLPPTVAILGAGKSRDDVVVRNSKNGNPATYCHWR